MNLNLYILREELAPISFTSVIYDNPAVLSCVFPIPFSEGSVFDERDVTIADAHALPKAPDIRGHPSLICIGKPPERYLEAPFNTIYTDADIELVELLRKVLLVFDRYLRWELQLQEIVSQNRPLKELAQASLPFFNNPICVARPNFKLLFHVMDPKVKLTDEQYRMYCADYGGSDVPVEDNTYLRAEGINEMIADPKYLDVLNATEAFIGKLGNSYYRTLAQNIRTPEGICYARLIVDEVISPLTEKDISLAEILVSYLERSLQVQDIDSFNRPEGLDEVLQDLLAHRLIPEKRIREVLDALQWKVNDEFFCMVLASNSFERDADALGTVAVQLLQQLSSDCFAVFEKHLILVFNLTQNGQSRDDLLRLSLPLFRDNLLAAGISLSYHDFKDLYYYYLQAMDALDMGMRSDPTTWYYRYEDYLLQSELERLKGQRIPRSLLPAGLILLLDYDEKNGTNYTEFLRYYIEHNMNALMTSRAFYLHRNTSGYRLNRIHEISNLDLDDSDVRLELEIAFKIMDLG